MRPLEDDEVDRAEVEVQQCTELTVTNRSTLDLKKSCMMYAVFWVQTGKTVLTEMSLFFIITVGCIPR